MRTYLLGLALTAALLGSQNGSQVMAQGFHVRLDTIGSGLAQVGRAIIELTNGEFAISSVGGWVHDSLYWSATTSMIILDSEGEYISVHNIDVPDKLTYNGHNRSMVQLPDGRFVIGGNAVDTGLVGVPALYWFDASGQALSYTEVTALPGHIVRQMNKAHDGGFVMVGDVRIGNDDQAFLVKTDSTGLLEWSQLFGSTTYRDALFSIERASDGTYYVGGVKGVGNNSWDPWLLRVDSLGNEIWSFTNGTPFNDLGQAHLITLADGNFVYGSGVPTGIDMDQRPQLVKVDSTGTILWSKTYDVATRNAFVAGVKEITPGGDLIACGFSTPIDPYYDGFLCRTNSQGDSLWLRHYWYTDSIMNDGIGHFWDVTPTSDGGFAAVGVMIQSMSGNDPPGASQDVWVVKVDSMGCIQPGCHIITGIESIATNLNNALTVYPNPASGSTTVQIALPQALQSGQLRLVLVNAQGQLVQEVSATQGNNMLNLAGLAAGLYYLHLANEHTWLSGTKLIVE